MKRLLTKVCTILLTASMLVSMLPVSVAAALPHTDPNALSVQEMSVEDAHVIAADDMKVTLSTEYPSVEMYEVDGVAVTPTSGTPTGQVLVNGTRYTPEMMSLDIDGNAAEYVYGIPVLVSDNSAEANTLVIGTTYSVQGGALTVESRVLHEPEGFTLETFAFADAVLCLTGEVSGAAAYVANNANPSDIYFEKNTRANSYVSYPFVANDVMGAGFLNNVAETGQKFIVRVSGETLTVETGAWNYRGSGVTKATDDTTTPPLENMWYKLILTEDVNGDDTVDWQDAAAATRREMERADEDGEDPYNLPEGADEIRDYISYVAVNLGSGATQNFLRSADIIKNIYNLTDGFGQMMIQKGFQAEGHDDSHPDIGRAGIRQGGWEDFITLLEESHKYNAKVGVHVNLTEFHLDSLETPNEENIFQAGKGDRFDNPYRANWDGQDTAYWVNRDVDILSGAQQERFRDLFNKTSPDGVTSLLDFIYVDVYYNTDWISSQTEKMLREYGWWHATEFPYAFDQNAIWCHWGTDLSYPVSGSGSVVHRFLFNSFMDRFIACAEYSTLLRGAVQPGAAGWNPDNDLPETVATFYNQNLPTKYLQHFGLLSWNEDDTEALFEDGVFSCVGADGNTYIGRVENSVEKIYAICEPYKVGTDMSVMTENESLVFLPWDPVEEDKIYHWNPYGGTTTWTLPDSWGDVSTVILYSLSDTEGRAYEATFEVNSAEHTVTIEAEADTPYIIVKGETQEERRSVEWGVGSYLKDFGFEEPDLTTYWTVSNTNDITVSSDAGSLTASERRTDWGDGTVVVAGGQGGSISQEMTGLTSGRSYTASVWYLVDSGQRDVTLSVVGAESTVLGSVTYHQSTVPNRLANSKYQGTNFQRLIVDFVADGETAVFDVSIGEGESVVYLNDARVFEQPGHTEHHPDGFLYFENFENVDEQHGVLLKTANTGNQQKFQMVYRDADFGSGANQKITYALDGNNSVKATYNYSNSGMSIARTDPALVTLEAGKTYEAAVLYSTVEGTDYQLRVMNGSTVEGYTALTGTTDTPLIIRYTQQNDINARADEADVAKEARIIFTIPANADAADWYLDIYQGVIGADVYALADYRYLVIDNFYIREVTDAGQGDAEPENWDPFIINASSAAAVVGDTLDLSYTGGDTSLAVTWSSGNESVATISGTTLTAVGAGTAVITGTRGSESDSITITVAENPAEATFALDFHSAEVVDNLVEGVSWAVSGTEHTLAIEENGIDGPSLRITQNINNSNGAAKLLFDTPAFADGTLEFDLQFVSSLSSGEAQVALLYRYADENNWNSFTHVKQETAGTRYNYSNTVAGRSYYSATTGLPSLAQGVTAHMKIEFEGTNAALYLQSEDGAYTRLVTSSSTNICQEAGKTGIYIFYKNAATGPRKILIDNVKATYKSDGIAEVQEIQVTGPKTVTTGKTAVYTAIVKPLDAVQDVTWTSSDENVATIDANGTLTPVSAGTAIITATGDGGKSADYDVTVKDSDSEEITLTISGEDTVGVKCTSPYTAGPTSDEVIWTVTAGTGEAKISESGMLTGIKAGTVIVKAQLKANENAVGEKVISIENVGVNSVALYGPAAVVVGEHCQYSTLILPECAADRTVTWSSSNADVATIDSRGVLTAVGSGTTLITATASNGQSVARMVDVGVMDITITRQPEDQTVSSGSILGVLQAQAEARPSNNAASYPTEPIYYQWYQASDPDGVNGVALTGSAGKSLLIPQELSPGEYYFYCEITCADTSVVTRTATVTVEQGDEKLSAPINVVLSANGTISFDSVDGAEYYYVYLYRGDILAAEMATAATTLDVAAEMKSTPGVYRARAVALAPEDSGILNSDPSLFSNVIETVRFTYSAGPNGTVSAALMDSDTAVASGDCLPVGSGVIFTAAPIDGYAVSDWGDATASLEDSNIASILVTGMTDVQVTFGLNIAPPDCEIIKIEDGKLTVQFADVPGVPEEPDGLAPEDFAAFCSLNGNLPQELAITGVEPVGENQWILTFDSQANMGSDTEVTVRLSYLGGGPREASYTAAQLENEEVEAWAIYTFENEDDRGEDSSGNGRYLTPVSGTSFSVAYNDQKGSWVLAPDKSKNNAVVVESFDISQTDFSFAMWFNVNNFRNGPIFFAYDAAGKPILGYSNNEFYVGFSSSNRVKPEVSLETGVWYSLVFTAENVRGKTYDIHVYLNGREVYNEERTNLFPSPPNSQFLFGSGYNTSYSLDGYMDDIKLYDGIVLTAAQVKAMYIADGGADKTLLEDTIATVEKLLELGLPGDNELRELLEEALDAARAADENENLTQVEVDERQQALQILIDQITLPELKRVTFLRNYSEDDCVVYAGIDVLDGDRLALPDAPARDGYVFAGWAAEDGTSAVDGMVITAELELYAQWEKIGQSRQIIVVAAGNGSAAAEPASAEAGVQVTLAAAPDHGAAFVRWEIVAPIGLTLEDEAALFAAFTMPDSHVSVRAVFETVPTPVSADEYLVTFTGCTGGLLAVTTEDGTSISSGTYVAEGVTLYVTATPRPGYCLNSIQLNGRPLVGNSFQITEDSHIEVVFEKTVYPSVIGTTTGTVRPEPEPELLFTDVSNSAYYYDAVRWAMESGVTNGYGNATTFAPDVTCSRAEAVTFIWRAAGQPEPVTADTPFTDVSAGAYYYDAVLWAVENGITNGYGSATTFAPDVKCSRAEIVTFLYRAAGSFTANSESGFSDVSNRAYYANAVTWAVENGVTNGYGSATIFAPDVKCSRAEIVTFLYRVYVA